MTRNGAWPLLPSRGRVFFGRLHRAESMWYLASAPLLLEFVSDPTRYLVGIRATVSRNQPRRVATALENVFPSKEEALCMRRFS